MRDYGKVAPTFWTGHTGQRIKKLGPEAVTIALYLITGPSANMIGLYYLPLGTIAADTGIATARIAEILGRFDNTDFAHYDAEDQVIWVPEMARYQIGPSISAKNTGMIAHVEKTAARYAKCGLFKEFVRRYGKPYHLNFEESPGRLFDGVSQPRSAAAAAPNADETTEPTRVKATVPRRDATGSHAELIRRFCARWKEKYGADYSFRAGQDGAHIKWILTQVVDNVEAADNMLRRYFQDDDEFVAVKNRHNLGLFVHRFNNYKTDAPPVTGGPHARAKPNAEQRGEFRSDIELPEFGGASRT